MEIKKKHILYAEVAKSDVNFGKLPSRFIKYNIKDVLKSFHAYFTLNWSFYLFILRWFL